MADTTEHPPASIRRSALLAVAYLSAAMVSIQTGASLAKRLFPLAGPEGVTALRVTIAAIILILAWRPWRWRLSGKGLRAAALYGGSLGLMNLLFYLALRDLALGPAVTLEFVGPMAVALIGARRRIEWLWGALAAAGVLMFSPLGWGAALNPVGMVFALGAGACWAAYIVFGKQAGAEAGPGAAAWGMVAAAAVTAPVGIAHAGAALFAPAVLGPAALVAVLSSAVPYSLEMIALRRLPGRIFSVMMSLEPAIAAVCGFVWLGERLSLVECLAIAAVITASFGAALTAREELAATP